MSVDLRTNSAFARVSLLVMPDCLVKLEHGRTEDRVRKFMFDAIGTVVIWRKVPWARVLVCALLLAAPGVALLFVRETAVVVIGGVLLVFGVALCLWYLYCGSTTVRVVRNGEPYDITGIFRPGRVRKFREKLVTGIRAVQADPAAAARQSGFDVIVPPPA